MYFEILGAIDCLGIARIVCRAFFSAQKGCGCARFFTPTVFEFFSAIRIVLSSVIVCFGLWLCGILELGSIVSPRATSRF